jgi:hypothetical protein
MGSVPTSQSSRQAAHGAQLQTPDSTAALATLRSKGVASKRLEVVSAASIPTLTKKWIPRRCWEPNQFIQRQAGAVLQISELPRLAGPVPNGCVRHTFSPTAGAAAADHAAGQRHGPSGRKEVSSGSFLANGFLHSAKSGPIHNFPG